MSLILFTGDRAFSSWSMRAKVALVESGVSFEEIYVGLDWPYRHTEFGDVGVPEKDIPPEPAAGCGLEWSQLASADPTGLINRSFFRLMARVPALIDTDTETLAGDTLAIVELLDELGAPNSLLGQGPQRRSAIRTFASHIHADYLPMMGGMSYGKSFRLEPGAVPTKTSLEQAARLCSIIESLRADAAASSFDAGYLFGTFSLADVMVAPIAKAFAGWRYLDTTSAVVADYLRLLLVRPSVTMHLAEAQSMYSRVDRYAPGTPAWIANHYRHNERLKVIHNWRSDVYHQLDNEVAELAYLLAVDGHSLTDIVNTVATQFDADATDAERDIRTFFDHISPENDDVIVASEFVYRGA